MNRTTHRTLFAGLILALAAATQAQERKDTPKRPPFVISPQLNLERKVTFRLRAPNAKEVKVSGELAIGTQDMKRGDDGIWSITIGPLEPELYGYSFIVDGVRIPDPGNSRIKPMRSPTTSILDIPGKSPLIHDYRDVPHGNVRLHEYRSGSLCGEWRRLRVYVPPGYDADAQVRYPVLYLFHDSGDNEATWTELGRAHLILDNLIAEKKAKPMLIVMTDGHPVSDPTFDRSKALGMFEHDLLNDVVPLIDSTYRTKADRLNRAIIGLSMGGMQSMTIGLARLDTFAWVAGMSASLPDPGQRVIDALNDPKVNEKLKLFWVAIGKDDILLKRMEETKAMLKAKNVKHTYLVTAGNHSWPVRRKYLADFAPLLFGH